jgi:hypothetical protein
MSDLAINTRIATRDEAPAGTPLLERVCSYCRSTLGWVVCVPESDGERSHGACVPCVEGERKKMNEAASYLRREYTLEIGAAGEEPATQAATPQGGDAGAVNANATEALRGPVSSFLSAAGGADEAGPHDGERSCICPTENAPDCGKLSET